MLIKVVWGRLEQTAFMCEEHFEKMQQAAYLIKEVIRDPNMPGELCDACSLLRGDFDIPDYKRRVSRETVKR